MTTNLNINSPSSIEIDICLKEWKYPKDKKNEKYSPQERSLIKLFSAYPFNKDLDDVLIKVSSLNDFYSTRIRDTFLVAKRITQIHDIDERLKNCDLTIVHDIATGHGKKTKNGNEWTFYSFATKYCSHHYPTTYPIYDSYVAQMLLYFKNHDTEFKQFNSFKRNDLKLYQNYSGIIKKFIEFYGLKKYTLKEIDKYLWMTGKFHFAKKSIVDNLIVG